MIGLAAPLLDDPATAAQFGAQAELAALVQVWAALAGAQGALGVIPADSAAFLVQALPGLRIDPAALAQATARDGVPVPGLLAALQALLPPEHAQWLHWGATSQDIMDTALALRLRAVLDLSDGQLAALTGALAGLAGAHADLPMAARTYGQTAVPTSFGAVVAGWGWPLLAHRAALAGMRPGLLIVSMAGAAGTLAAMGPQGPQVRAGLACGLGLGDPGHGWHSDRSGMAALAGWAAGLAATLGKLGDDLLLMTQSGLALVSLGQPGGSSTMPQKQNPVAPSALVALARHVIGLSATLTGAGLHRQQRDGAAWFTEWLTLPPLCVALGRALALAADLSGDLAPLPEAMQRDLGRSGGLIHAEALTFALARTLPMTRPAAQAAVQALCLEAVNTGADLIDLAERRFPGRGWHGIIGPGLMGQAPQEARDFAAAVGAGRPDRPQGE